MRWTLYFVEKKTVSFEGSADSNLETHPGSSRYRQLDYRAFSSRSILALAEQTPKSMEDFSLAKEIGGKSIYIKFKMFDRRFLLTSFKPDTSDTNDWRM